MFMFIAVINAKRHATVRWNNKCQNAARHPLDASRLLVNFGNRELVAIWTMSRNRLSSSYIQSWIILASFFLDDYSCRSRLRRWRLHHWLRGWSHHHWLSSHHRLSNHHGLSLHHWLPLHHWLALHHRLSLHHWLTLHSWLHRLHFS